MGASSHPQDHGLHPPAIVVLCCPCAVEMIMSSDRVRVWPIAMLVIFYAAWITLLIVM